MNLYSHSSGGWKSRREEARARGWAQEPWTIKNWAQGTQSRNFWHLLSWVSEFLWLTSPCMPPIFLPLYGDYFTIIPLLYVGQPGDRWLVSSVTAFKLRVNVLKEWRLRSLVCTYAGFRWWDSGILTGAVMGWDFYGLWTRVRMSYDRHSPRWPSVPLSQGSHTLIMASHWPIEHSHSVFITQSQKRCKDTVASVLAPSFLLFPHSLPSLGERVMSSPCGKALSLLAKTCVDGHGRVSSSPRHVFGNGQDWSSWQLDCHLMREPEPEAPNQDIPHS